MLYDVSGDRVVQRFRPHGDEVRTVRFSNAAYYLLSGPGLILRIRSRVILVNRRI